MSSEFERKGGVRQFYEDLAAIRRTLLKLKRTMDTDGCYNPFNKGAPYLGKIVGKVRCELEGALK